MAAADDPSGVDPPPELPDLTVLGRLGGGGMGVVYRVRDPLDREFALKLARRDHLSERGRERFLEEAKAMRDLDHPHVARVHAYRITPAGQPYFLMPIYPGSLADRLAEFQADPQKAVRLMAAVADGVGHLHAKGFIHRDLKPHNILLDADGRPAVSDFGLVKSLSESGGGDAGLVGAAPGSGETRPSGGRRSNTRTGAVLGTRRYMAPEQAAGLTHLASPRWDVWALGVVLHELLVGEPPRSSWSPERLLDPNEPDNPPPAHLKPGLDPGLERVIRKCLARDPKERYADGNEVATALRTWRPRRVRPWRAWAVAAAVVAAVGLAAAGWAAGLWPGGGQAPDDPFVAGPPADPLGPEGGGPELAEFLPKGGGGPEPRWRLGETVGTLRPWPTDGALTLATRRQAVVEYLPPGARDAVRVGARVRMNDRQAQTGRAGVYAAGTDVRTAAGVYQAFIEVGFTDNQHGFAGDYRVGQATLAARVVGIAPEGPRPLSAVHVAGPDLAFPSPRPPAGADEPYHDLTLEVTRDRARAWFDGRFVAEANTADLAAALTRQLSEYLAAPPADPVRFDPAGGAGLFASDASGSYARFRAGPAGR
jgi:hypothetical protein